MSENIRPSNLGLKSSRSDSYSVDSSSWDSKRLPLQLVNTLEEALAGLNQQSKISRSDSKKFSLQTLPVRAAISSSEKKSINGKLSTPTKPAATAPQMGDKSKLRDENLCHDQVSINASQRQCICHCFLSVLYQQDKLLNLSLSMSS
jgi:hypothetical protein